MPAKASYFRNGREIDEDEALDRNGIVRDGVAVRTSLMMRDGMSPVQRAIMLDQAITDAARDKHRNLLVTDGTANPLGMSKPGYRFFEDRHGEALKQAAYESYEHTLRDAYKNGGNESAATSFGEQGARCSPDRRIVDERECPGYGIPASDHRLLDANELESRRERTLRPVYDTYALELSQAYRRFK